MIFAWVLNWFAIFLMIMFGLDSYEKYYNYPLLNVLNIKEFNELGAVKTCRKQYDYGRLVSYSTCFLAAQPKDIQTLADLVKLAYQNQIPIRTQGNKHSENGSSLSRNNELLIHTALLNEIVIKNNHAIVVGGGVPVSLINPLLNQFHLRIPVYSGGGVGPTLGGYIAAGGLGSTSNKFGGFWEHVNYIKLVTGDGHILTIKKNDPIFLWLFGSMGQLGIIVEAELEIQSDSLLPDKKFKGMHTKVDASNLLRMEQRKKPLYWFTIFVTEQEFIKAKYQFDAFRLRYPNALHYLPNAYGYVKYFKNMPPLIFPHKSDFHVMVIWGEKNAPSSDDEFIKLTKACDDFIAKNHYKKYIQAEREKSPQEYQRYFGDELYKQFANIKKQLDPQFLFDQGTVFKEVNKQ